LDQDKEKLRQPDGSMPKGDDSGMRQGEHNNTPPLPKPTAEHNKPKN
tara:strand:- start:1105 stop:1245 length:141 start_codon:yes stop_codon:yes gene_type:complete